MQKLYFQKNNNKRKFIDYVGDAKQTYLKIRQFLLSHNYDSHYTRQWYDSNTDEWTFDVGSWSEFFILTGAGPNFFDTGEEE